MSANSVQARRYMEFFAEIPYALHPAPKRALLVSYGLGSTAAALLTVCPLAALLARIEAEEDFLKILTDRSRERAWMSAPSKERESWESLLAELL